ncbi:MAG: trehalose-phosphatase [Microthrixaceae bacterium]
MNRAPRVRISLEDALALVCADAGPLADAVVATDFDGTLAPIVDDPADARPLPGAAQVLVRLQAAVGQVAVVSGRPVAFLEEHCPPGLTLVGLYGLESVRDGVRADHPTAGIWRETLADVATAAGRHGPAGMRVESKGLSLTLHYRGDPGLAAAVQDYATDAAALAGLHVRTARMSVELHPPIDEDKGTALERLAAGHTGPVLYLGDDVGDLPAFDALDRLEDVGRTTLRVVVGSDEMSPALAARADLLLDGPPAVLELLTRLADAAAATG